MEALSGRLAELLAGAPDDPILLVGAMLVAWLPMCAFVLGCLALMATVQSWVIRRRRPAPGIVLPPLGRRPLVTRRSITNPRRTNGFPAMARVALAVVVVTGFTAFVLASSGSLLLASLRG